MTRMKESSIDWIGQIPEEWEIVKFKYLFNTSKGLSITKEYLVDEGIPVINYGQIHSSLTKQVQSCDDRLPFVANYYLSKKGVKLNQGDFVFADTSEDLEGAGNFSTRLDSTGQLLAGYHTIIARLNDYDEHDFRYFMHLFDSLAIRKQIQNKVSGVKVYSVTQGILNSIFVIIPPKNEQQKIADFLDKKTAQLDKVKALLEEQIQKLKDYRASLIYETVTKGLDKTVPMKDSGIDWIGQVPEGWGVSKLKFILEKGINSIKVGPFGSSLSGDAIRSSGKWVYNQRNVLDNNFTETDFYISEAKCKELKNFSVSSGDILLTTRGTIGRVAIVPKKYCEGIIHPCLMKFKVDSKIVLPELIKYLFNDIPLVREQLNFLSNSTTIDVIYSYNLKNIIIPIIPIEEQYSTLEVLDRQTSDVDSLIKIKQKHIENINKQRQTLIYDYVTGKRRV